MRDMRSSELIIEELKKQREKGPTVNVELEMVKIVIFRLADSFFAFPGGEVKEILPFMDIFPIPGSPEFIPGVINNRGDIESVINLNGFLGLAAGQQTSSSRILIVSASGMRSGIAADEVLDVVDVPCQTIKPPLLTLDNDRKELVSGELLYNDRTIVMLDIALLFRKLCTPDE